MEIYDMKPHKLLGLNYANTTDEKVEKKYLEKKELVEKMRQGEMKKKNVTQLDSLTQSKYDKWMENLDKAYEQLKTEELRKQYAEKEKAEMEQKQENKANHQGKISQMANKINDKDRRIKEQQNKTLDYWKIRGKDITLESAEKQNKELEYMPIIKGKAIINNSRNNKEKEVVLENSQGENKKLEYMPITKGKINTSNSKDLKSKGERDR